MISELQQICEDWTDLQLAEAYKNAKTTFQLATGYNKARWNEYRMMVFLTELKKRNLPTPETVGVFNGFGTY